MKIFFRRLFVLSILAQNLWAALPLSELTKDSSTYWKDKGVLPQSQYIEVEVVKLKNPKLLWVNIPLLKQMGFEINNQITPEQERELLNSLAWVTKDRYTTRNEVTDEKRKMLTDFYGGTGIGSNSGSARAISSGYVQIKGSGLTPHNNSFDKTGRSTTHEAIKDAVWGEVLNNELSFGANRLIAIIDRGGSTEDGERQVLEVRLDPVRSGHFIPREFSIDPIEIARVKESAKNLILALPQPSEEIQTTKASAQQIALGLMEYSKRIGTQYGEMFMKRIYHGATSESNIEINGRMIDFGTASSQPSYEKIQFLRHVMEFGINSEIEDLLIKSIFLNLQLDQNLRVEIKKYVNVTILVSEFRTAYDKARQIAALQLFGLPKASINELLLKHSNLAKKLVDLADLDLKKSEKISLTRYPDFRIRPVSSLQLLTEKWIASENLKGTQFEHLSTEINLLMADGRAWAAKQGMDGQSFFKLVKYNSRFINRPIKDLYITDLKKLTQKANTQLLNGDYSAISKTINKIIKRSMRVFNQLSWYEAPLNLQIAKNGEFILNVYDGKNNQSKAIPFINEDKFLSRTNNSLETITPQACRKLFK